MMTDKLLWKILILSDLHGVLGQLTWHICNAQLFGMQCPVWPTGPWFTLRQNELGSSFRDDPRPIGILQAQNQNDVREEDTRTKLRSCEAIMVWKLQLYWDSNISKSKIVWYFFIVANDLKHQENWRRKLGSPDTHPPPKPKFVDISPNLGILIILTWPAKKNFNKNNLKWLSHNCIV